MSNTPSHLGGHAGTTHVDAGALQMFYEIGCRSMVDIGCGPGGQVDVAKAIGFCAHGIDGDHSCSPLVINDYTRGPSNSTRAELIWCVEFLEHLERRYLHHLAKDISASLADYIVITHALPGHGGHHHVNCQPPEYWQGFFAALGYLPSESLTEQLKSASTMRREFIQKTGTVYRQAWKPSKTSA